MKARLSLSLSAYLRKNLSCLLLTVPFASNGQTCSLANLNIDDTYTLDYGYDAFGWGSTAINTDADGIADDGFVIVGETFINSTLKRQGLIVRLNPDLTDSSPGWVVTYGSNGNDVLYAVRQAPNGNIVVCGTKETTQYTQDGSNDAWFMELSLSSGTIVGERVYGGSGNEDAFDIEVDTYPDPDQYVIAGGTGRYQDGVFDEFDDPPTNAEPEIDNKGEYWLFAIDPTDDADDYNIIWQAIFDGDNTITNAKDWATGLIIDDDQRYVIAGRCVSCDDNTAMMQAMLVKTENDGDELWKDHFGDATNLNNARDQMAFDVIQTDFTTNTYLTVGISHPGQFCLIHDHDFYGLKVSGTGINIWSSNCVLHLDEGKGYGRDEDDNAYSAVRVACGDGGYLIVGSTGSPSGNDDVTCNFDTSEPFTTEIWLLKVSSTGAIEWDQSLGGSQNDAGYSIEAVWDGSYIITGALGTSANSHDLVVFKISLDECEEEKLSYNGQSFSSQRLSVYPNPSNGLFEVELQLENQFSGTGTIELLTPTGRVVSSSEVNIEDGLLHQQFAVSDVPSGFYWVRISTAVQVYQTKLILELNR